MATPGSKPEGSTEGADRASRLAQRTEKEQEAKRRAQSERSSGSSTIPGVHRSVTSTTSAATSDTDRNERMRTRAKQEQNAKSRGPRSKDSSRPGALSVASSADQDEGKERTRRKRGKDSKIRVHRSRTDDSENVVPGAHPSSKTSSSTDRARRSKEARNRGSAASATPQPVAAAAEQSTQDGSAKVRPSGTIELQAEIVDEEADMERVKRNIQAENRRLQTEMERENERLRKQMEEENEALRNEMTRTESVNDEDKKLSKKCKIIIAAILFVLLAGGLGAYFGTRDNSSNSATSVTPQTTKSPTVGGPSAPTLPPVTVESASPTQTPVYARPSPQDCGTISNGNLVQGQLEMATKSFDVDLEVNLSVDTIVDDVLDAITAKSQDILIPDLAGCFEDRRSLMLRDITIRGRSLNDAPRRFAIANGNVSYRLAVSQSCEITSGGACYNIVAALDLAVKSDSERISVLTSIIIEVFGVEDLVSVLDLGPPFEQLDLIGVKSNTPTDAPSAFPTGMPSSVPTKVPTTDAPTQVPITATASPSIQPTDGECEESCIGDAACEFDERDVEVGCDACFGNGACELMDGGSVDDGSCHGEDACGYLINVTIGLNSCLGDRACACLEKDSVLGDNECQEAGDCCSEGGGPLSVSGGSCSPEGEQTCMYASGPIGSNSCSDEIGTCFAAKASIGDNSCNDGGCGYAWGEIADNACNGFNACPGSVDMEILPNSCNCDSCCSCLENYNSNFIFVPSGSCNSLAPSAEFIDFDPDEFVDGPIQYCCADNDQPPDECEESCIGDAACEFDEGDVEVGCDACFGNGACELMDGGSVDDGSCHGEDACGYLINVTIGLNSCLGDRACACLEKDSVLEDNECQEAGDCCSEGGGPLSVSGGSCSPKGSQTCMHASGPIGSNSCSDEIGTCFAAKASIGDNSCNDGGCGYAWGEIADNACNGSNACPGSVDMEILPNSCNCDSCCSCLENYNSNFIFVPSGSCNSLAPSAEFIDFDPDEFVDGPIQYCCTDNE